MRATNSGIAALARSGGLGDTPSRPPPGTSPAQGRLPDPRPFGFLPQRPRPLGQALAAPEIRACRRSPEGVKTKARPRRAHRRTLGGLARRLWRQEALDSRIEVIGKHPQQYIDVVHEVRCELGAGYGVLHP